MTDSYETKDGRKKHDARITYDVIDGYLARMSGSACKVYLALCRHANWTTDETFVKIGTIAKLCGLSPGTVSKSLAELVELKLIRREERYRPDGSRTSDLITLLDPPPLEKDADPPNETDTYPGYEVGGDTNKQSLIQPILSTLSEERQPPAASAAGTRKRAKPRDPRRTSPAIRAIQTVKETKAVPPKEIWDSLIKVLGSEPDIGLLRRCRTEWAIRGYNRNSYAWALEWYEQGGPPKRNGGGVAEPAGMAGIREYRRQHNMVDTHGK